MNGRGDYPVGPGATLAQWAQSARADWWGITMAAWTDSAQTEALTLARRPPHR